jgi:hypothetical protein
MIFFYIYIFLIQNESVYLNKNECYLTSEEKFYAESLSQLDKMLINCNNTHLRFAFSISPKIKLINI